MRRDLRIVSPYRPFPPESGHHHRLAGFDWIAALRMLAVSVERSCDCQTVALTDVDTTLPVPAIQVTTTQRRLMLWILDVSLRYLESPAFDRNTIMVSPDTLILKDLRPLLTGADLTLLVRTLPKYKNRPILNSVQWWPLAARARLIAFYRQALDVALTQLDEESVRWGADCEALRRLVAPIKAGPQTRAGLLVNLIEARSVLWSITKTMPTPLNGLTVPDVAIIDFKGPRKIHMATYFDRLVGVPC